VTRPVLLDHTIVGQSLTSLTIRKDREFAGCRICGAIFQPKLNTDTPDELYTELTAYRAHEEITRWRIKHNKRHAEREHLQFRDTGLTLSPRAAHRLAPYGLIPVLDAQDPEIADAMRTAPRAPYDDVEH
jgi:hypothetical protein